MFPFTSYEATKVLVDQHIAELRGSGRHHRVTRVGRRHFRRSDSDTRAAR